MSDEKGALATFLARLAGQVAKAVPSDQREVLRPQLEAFFAAARQASPDGKALLLDATMQKILLDNVAVDGIGRAVANLIANDERAECTLRLLPGLLTAPSPSQEIIKLSQKSDEALREMVAALPVIPEPPKPVSAPAGQATKINKPRLWFSLGDIWPH